MIGKLRNWRYGLHRLKQGEINRLSFPDDILLKVEPAKCPMDSLLGMQRVLYMLRQYPGRFSFEIWKDETLSLHFFSSKSSVEGLLESQLKSLYPVIKIQKDDKPFPWIKEGDYVACCTLRIYGKELNLACAENFRREPYIHVIEALNGADKVVVQILFEGLRKIPKNRRFIVAQKYGIVERAPLFQCLIRIVSFSEDGCKAWESCEHVARTFSVFDSDSHLMPEMLSYPLLLIRNPYRFLKSMVERRFPLFSKDFIISAPELAPLVHLPVGAEEHGVDYSKPGLAPPPFL